jgi:hypothetical protein
MGGPTAVTPYAGSGIQAEGKSLSQRNNSSQAIETFMVGLSKHRRNI